MTEPPARDARSHSFLNRRWWAMGQDVPGYGSPRVNETATRARAGMLNVLSTATILLLVFAPQLDPVVYVGPLVIFDMVMAATTGLTPFSPFGLLGTLATMRIRPLWKPIAPKRFAWTLGGMLGAVCLTMRMLHVANAWLIGVVSTCFVLTWLEVALGFCVGCWMHKLFFGCVECEVPYARE